MDSGSVLLSLVSLFPVHSQHDDPGHGSAHGSAHGSGYGSAHGSEFGRGWAGGLVAVAGWSGREIGDGLEQVEAMDKTERWKGSQVPVTVAAPLVAGGR